MPNQYDSRKEFPDAYYTARKIKEWYRFADKNKAIRIHQVSLTVVHNLLLSSLKNAPSFSEDKVFETADASAFFCFTIFHHIYLSGYREQDFASLDNFQACFINFQHLLWQISAAYRRHGSWIHEKLPNIKLFDIKNLAENADQMKRWNCMWQQITDGNSDK